MWQVRFMIGVARPWARGRKRLMVGPSSTVARTMRSSRTSRPLLWSALAIADWSTLRTGTAAARVL